MRLKGFSNKMTLSFGMPDGKILCMTEVASTKPKKINLRRPDVMKEVQAEVVTHYRSTLVEYIREHDNRVVVPGRMTIRLAKQFGFCYGVERAD